MNNILLKRVVSGALAGVMALTFVACGQSTNSGKTETSNKASQGSGDKIFSEPTTIKVAISSSASWPFNKDWKLWKYFGEGTGATFDIQAIPDSDIATKIPLMLSSNETMPDMLYLDSKEIADAHSSSGAFISLSENFDKLPSMTTFLDTLPEETRKEILRQRLGGDGQIYEAPLYGTHTIQNLRTWMYREDIFKKHNLSVPTTMEEVYQTAKKLKKLYPNSYPVCMRDALWQFAPMAAQWKNNLCLYTYYDFKDNKWCYGAQQPEIKQMVEYFLKLYNEKLVPPDYVNISTKSWEELVSTDRAFMMLEYMVRIDFFNLPNRKTNPEYTWAIMEPPKADSPTGQRMLGKTNVDYRGYAVCNTGDEKRIDNSFKVLDWMYTDKGSELLSWGKEGETYKVENGVRRFILPNKEVNAAQEYGVATTGLCQRIAVEANEASYSDEQAKQGHQAIKWNETNTNPVYWLAFDESVKNDVDTTKGDLKTYVDEMISKFMIGQKPMSEWDSFQKGLKDMGVEKLLNYYTEAYDKVTKTDLKW